MASALCVHHLDGAQKAICSRGCATPWRRGGRFVLADVVVPPDPADAVTSLTPGFDHPDSFADQLAWLGRRAL